MDRIYSFVDKLYETNTLHDCELLYLIEKADSDDMEYLFEKARERSQSVFGNKVYVRGLIEFSNYCKNNCFYCGIGSYNHNVRRYRLTKEQILSCCQMGHKNGIHSFVLQSGEDMYYSDDIMCDIVSEIRNSYPDCAITLSIGEKSYDSYKKYYDAGADRFLLRHETADPVHYSRLHPEYLTLENRMKCLDDLKSIGYQTGVGFMVGSPYQTPQNIIKDLRFIEDFKPHMIGIGPFIPHHDTIFRNEKTGSLRLCLALLSIIRLMQPDVLLPSTTALGTIAPNGRELGILAGANVVMPNLSPQDNRKEYSLYDNKIATDEEAVEGLDKLRARMTAIGYELSGERGDHMSYTDRNY